MNAAHALTDRSPQDGSIKIATSETLNDIILTITDNGCGIPDNIKDKIFDPFFTTKDVGKGTGQGLALTHDVIVGKHNGHIEVETSMGVGTTFKIYLPKTLS
ncbi:sensor histidine kinase [Candidatus Terasakiella magnetica]|uniref:sensor histidine kinase n=1 Tax=Candidatus Terasakiella magnetica TaxID=1867952 RepID=UPI003B836971